MRLSINSEHDQINLCGDTYRAISKDIYEKVLRKKFPLDWSLRL